MKEEPINKCKEQGFVHAWRDITENIVYTTMPPQYPPKKEQCQNCGLTRTHYERKETWFEYKLEPLQSINGFITTSNVSLTDGASTATNGSRNDLITDTSK